MKLYVFFFFYMYILFSLTLISLHKF